MRWLRWLFCLPIRFYRRVISPLKSRPTCRFTPTCSAYAMEAIEKRGVVMGCILALWRLLRCQPFCVGGYDPVPEHGFPKRRRKPDEPPKLICQDYMTKKPYKHDTRSDD